MSLWILFLFICSTSFYNEPFGIFFVFCCFLDGIFITSETVVANESVTLTGKDIHQLLFLFHIIFVKDSAELIERVLCVTAQCRDVLRRILPDVNGSLCNGRLCPAARVALNGRGIGGQIYKDSIEEDLAM